MSETQQLDAQKLRIRVGVADDPAEPIADALGTDEDAERALRLVHEDGTSVAALTLDDGLWAVAQSQDGEIVEGPIQRENVLAGLSRAESVRVVPYDEVQFTGKIGTRDLPQQSNETPEEVSG